MGDVASGSPGVVATEGAACAGHGGTRPARIALLGNPNTGKTTLFNLLTGLRHKTANFPGTTLEARVGRIRLRMQDAPSGGRAHDAELLDLPGVYSLRLEQSESAACRDVLAGLAAPRGTAARVPDVICLVLDAANLARNLVLAGEAMTLRGEGTALVVALNMIDVARRHGVTVDAAALSRELGVPVVAICARSGEGVAALRGELARVAPAPGRAGMPGGGAGAGIAPGGAASDGRAPSDEAGGGAGLPAWAQSVASRVVRVSREPRRQDATDRIDRVLTHPVLGLAVFVGVMGALFWTLFNLAAYPMDWIERLFAWAAGWVEGSMPGGIVRDLLAQGIVGGVGATVIFLPQICLLFFLISLLEDTGYLARAAFVVDRWLRPFGLPGHAFVPLLSSHACALPGIMAARGIPDARERLATILVAPFMTCSARLPVYVLLTTLLFRDRPWQAAGAFVGCYALGALAGVTSALVFRRTILRGRGRPMAMELPTYKRPSLRTALVTTWDRGLVFLKKAGTNILAICVILWWLESFPHVPPPPEAERLRERAAALGATGDVPAEGRPGADADGSVETRESLLAEADRLERRHAKERSFAGRIGRAVQPVFAPLGYDWQLSIGVVTSFAAREVFVSTMAVVVAGEEDAEAGGVLEAIGRAKRDDGVTPVFTRATCWSLLIYYVLAMQCLPTLAVTAREAGGWRWALLQLAWMSGVAYAAAGAVYWALA